MRRYFPRENHDLHVEAVPLADIAQRFGTPCYVYSRAALESAYADLDRAFGARAHYIYYAVKANGNLAVLDVLARAGAGFDIVSAGELARVLRVGAAPGRVVFSGVGKREDEMRVALEAGIHSFNVESLPELARLDALAQSMGLKAPVALRINPDVSADTHPYIATGLREHKFGIPLADARAAFTQAASMPGLDVRGIACHIGSQILDVRAFSEASAAVATLAGTLARDGIDIAHADLGGGLGIATAGGVPAPSALEYAKALSAPFADIDCEIGIEPGRAIAGPAGVLLTRVEYLKASGERHFAITDAGMSDLLRPALYQAIQPIVAVRDRPAVVERRYEVVGPLCESGDFLGSDRALRIEQGDLLAVLDAGAYGFCMSSQYNGRPRAAEVLVDGSEAHLVRERETLPDLFAGEHIP